VALTFLRLLSSLNSHDLADQQIAQLYELMQAIRKQELEENDPEYKPDR